MDARKPCRCDFACCLVTLFLIMAAFVGVGIRQRAVRLQNLAIMHTIKSFDEWDRRPYGIYLPPPEERAAYYKNRSRFKALAAYHGAMSDKYRRAIWRPWVELESDPFEPPHPSVNHRTRTPLIVWAEESGDARDE